jgi:hypothetical protein
MKAIEQPSTWYDPPFPFLFFSGFELLLGCKKRSTEIRCAEETTLQHLKSVIFGRPCIVVEVL